MTIIDAKEGRVERKAGATKVAIVGFSNISNHEAPFDEPEWEIWSHNWPGQDMREHGWGVDRWFQIHDPEVLVGIERDWLYACRRPIYTPEVDLGQPQSVAYPYGRVCEFLRARGLYFPMFASSMALEVALAIEEGFDEIGLYGVELPAGTPRERLCEYPSLALLVGFAAGLGIKIRLPETTSLFLYPFPYGLAYWDEVNVANLMVHSLRDRVRERGWGFVRRHRVTGKPYIWSPGEGWLRRLFVRERRDEDG